MTVGDRTKTLGERELHKLVPSRLFTPQEDLALDTRQEVDTGQWTAW